jgi:hypothetical protein
MFFYQRDICKFKNIGIAIDSFKLPFFDSRLVKLIAPVPCPEGGFYSAISVLNGKMKKISDEQEVIRLEFAFLTTSQNFINPFSRRWDSFG